MALSVYFYILAKTTYLTPLYGYKHYLSHIYHLIDVTYIYLYVFIKTYRHGREQGKTN